MFGKAYLAAMGLMIFLIGTGMSLVGEIILETCDKIASMPKGIEIAFNPCDIFTAFPTIAIVMQVLGIIIAGVTIFFIVKTLNKPKLICQNCKERAPEKSKFCPKCGTKLEKIVKSAKPKE